MALELIGEILKIIVLVGFSLAGIMVVQIWKKNLSTKVSYLRFFIQLVSVVSIYYIYSATHFLLFMLLAVFLATIFVGRFFCGWICPFGFYMDLTTAVRKALKIRYLLLPRKLNDNLNRLRYVILAAFIALPFISGLDSWVWLRILKGTYRPLMVLLAPLEPLIIPWQNGIALNGINFSFPYVSDIVHYGLGGYVSDIDPINAGGATTINLTGTVWFEVISFVALMLVASFLVRRFWCRFCPSGASASCLNHVKTLKIMPMLHIDKSEEKCTKCGICLRVCPLQVTEVYEQKGGKILSSMCMQCYRCVEMCPYEDALKVKIAGKTLFKSRNWLRPASEHEIKA